MRETNSGDGAHAGLFARLRGACAPEWRQYTEHPFLLALAEGSLPRAAFRHYLIQDFLFLRHLARAHGLAAYKARSVAEIRAASRALRAIVEVEMGLHETYCAAWGIESSALEAAREDGATLAYTRYLLERGMAGDLLDLQVALSPCTVGYGEIGARLLADENSRLENNPYRDWIEMYGGADYQAVAAQAVDFLDRVGRRRGAEPRMAALAHIFREATRLEAAFWRMALAAAE